MAGLLAFSRISAFPNYFSGFWLIQIYGDYSSGDCFGFSPNSLLDHPEDDTIIEANIY
jgi:hypothetical protein